MEPPGGLPGVPLPPAGARLPDAAPQVDTDQPMDEEAHQAALEEKGAPCCRKQSQGGHRCALPDAHALLLSHPSQPASGSS